MKEEVIDTKNLLDPAMIKKQKNLHRAQNSCQFSIQDEAGQYLDVPAGELCQEGPLLAGQDGQQVDGEVDAKRAKKSNLIVSKLIF